MNSALLLALAAGAAFASESPWRLVGIYDAATLLGMEVTEEEPLSYLWEPSPSMIESCGPAKAPDGLGMFEAEAIANAMTPTLAIVLEHDSAKPLRLTPNGVRVALGWEDHRYLFQPAVEPRYISVNIGGPGSLRYKQLVRTQLQMELCMEHKTGRGWIGGNSKKLRQAFLLDPPDMEGEDRKYFGGQRDPIPALLGAPEACLWKEEGLNSTGSVGGQGQGNLDLIPSDVWGASLRWCEDGDTGALSPQPNPVQLRLSEMETPAALSKTWTWSELTVDVGQGRRDDAIRVDVTWTEAGPAGSYDTRKLIQNEPLFSMPESQEGAPPQEPGLMDLLAQLPYYYPTLGPNGNRTQYTVLLIPNWQVVEGLRRLERVQEIESRGTPASIEDPMPRGGRGVMDGVGWVLEHPEFLYIQVPDGTNADWLNLTDPVAGILRDPWFGFPLQILEWGYTVGMLAGRKPIALPRLERPSWEQTETAHRARPHSLFVGCAALLSLMLGAGLRRIPDLWSDIPEERVDYWPGKAVDAAAPGEAEQPEAPSS